MQHILPSVLLSTVLCHSTLLPYTRAYHYNIWHISSTMRSQEPSKAKEPRMRDSCEACAKSKLKCSRDKPVCKRCQNRGLNCYYCPSQRAGRTSSTAAAAAVAASKRPRSPLTPKSTKSLSPQPQSVPPSKVSTSQSSDYGPFDFFEASMSSGDVNSEVMFLPPQEDMNFDTGMTDPLTFPTNMLDHFDMTYTFPDRSSTMQSSLISSEDSTTMFDHYNPASFQIQSPPPSLSIQESDPNHGLEERLPELVHSHSCFDAATSILSLQFSSKPTPCTLSTSGSQDSNLPTINNVITKNRTTIESISAMLVCPCSLDGHLTTIIFLIALKVIAWYAAVARAPSPESNCNTVDSASSECSPSSCSERVLQEPTTVGRYHLNGADQSRMRAQLVLSELHRVQRLVELLSKRLERVRQRSESTTSVHSTTSYEDTISASIFVQLEADLRRRLLTVSRETMEILREG